MTLKTLANGIGKAIIVLIVFGSFAVCCGTTPKKEIVIKQSKFIRA